MFPGRVLLRKPSISEMVGRLFPGKYFLFPTVTTLRVSAWALAEMTATAYALDQYIGSENLSSFLLSARRLSTSSLLYSSSKSSAFLS